MKKFIILLLKFAVPPVVLVLAFYAWMDPFKVLWHYDTYYESDSATNISLNKDYVTTANFNYRYAKEQYNAFIFGNSRSMAFEVASWKPYLPAGARPYHFDAFGETLFGLYKKIKYLDANNADVNNALLVLDQRILHRDIPETTYLFAISPKLVDNRNLVRFHFTFIKTFLSYKFIVPYLDYKINGFKPYMKYNLFVERMHYDPLINEMQQDYIEKQITTTQFYTPQRISRFYSRDTTRQQYYKPCLKENHRQMLKEIARILKQKNCNYKIIINPLYDQNKLDPADLDYLKQVFGADKVFDFSGINDITNNYLNYYEESHYRPVVANKILKAVYRKL